MKNKILIFVIILSVILNILLIASDSETGVDNEIFSYTRLKPSYNLPLSQSASCNFEKDVSVTYPDNKGLEERKIIYKLNTNSQPINISFIDLDTDNPKMRGNGGQSDLIKIVDNESIVTVVEKDPIMFGTLQSFSIFKNTGIGIWTKQYDLGSVMPFGLVSMGYCD